MTMHFVFVPRNVNQRSVTFHYSLYSLSKQSVASMADEDDMDVDLRSTEEDDHLKELQKSSAASVLSSGMDTTQSPYPVTPPMVTPTKSCLKTPNSGGKVAKKLRFSTPTKETSAPCLSSMFGHLSAIGSHSAVSLPSPELTPNMVDSVLSALKPKASTSEIIKALEELRIQTAQNTQMRRSPAPPTPSPSPRKVLSSSTLLNFPHGDSFIRLSNKSLIFACTEKNSNENRALRITNAGENWLQVRISVMTGRVFKILNGKMRTLYPGEQQVIWVEFRPNSGENFTDCLLVDNLTDEQQTKVHLLGLGGIPQLAMLKAPNLIEHGAGRYTSYTLMPKTMGHLYFGVESTGSRTAFCKVVVLSNNQVLPCVIRPTANVVLEQGEVKQFEIDLPVSEENAPTENKNLTVLLLWGLEFHRQRMTAFLHKSGHLPKDSAIAMFKEEFLGEIPFVEDTDHEVEMNDLETFNTSLHKIPIHVDFENAAAGPINMENLYIRDKISKDKAFSDSSC